jgi:hypothetical protein
VTAALAAPQAWCCLALRRAAAGLAALAERLEAPALDAAEPPPRDAAAGLDARARLAMAEERLRELRLRGARYY